MPQVLNDEELEEVTGGGANSAAKNDPAPKESVSLEYGGIIFSYSYQRAD